MKSQIDKNKKQILSIQNRQNTSQKVKHKDQQNHSAKIIQSAQTNPSSLTHVDIMTLHNTIGNKATGKLINGMIQREKKTFVDNQPKANAPIQRKLYYGEKSDREFSSVDEIIFFHKGAISTNVDLDELIYHFHLDGLFYVDFRGSIMGRHGYNILSIGEYKVRPPVAGRGSLEILPGTANPAGFEISGRPGWTDEIIGKLKPIKYRDNIRHIIPYHMIKGGFMTWLDEVLPTESGLDLLILFALELGISIDIEALAKDKAKAKAEAGAGALALTGDLAEATKAGAEAEAIFTQDLTFFLCGAILHRLNNIPGNLWAGDKKENQLLNAFRMRISRIKEFIKGGDQPGTVAFTMLSESADESREVHPIYSQIIQGALQHFPDDEETLNNMTEDDVIRILDLLYFSGEIDAMPSIPELDRLSEKEQAIFMENFPLHFEIVRLFQSGNMIDAMRALANLQDPYIS